MAEPALPHAGRVAVVTGAARGIGREIAAGLAADGATVVAADIGDLAETGELLSAAGPSPLLEALDVGDAEAIDAFAARVSDRLGRCDILINNAALLETLTWDQLDYETWQRVMRVNLDGPMLMCKALLPLMRERGWGRIINVSSGSIAVNSPISIAYRASKMGVIGLTRALALEVGADAITINAVCPSVTNTAMGAELPQQAIEAGVARQSIKRFAEPPDIAGAVLMLADDRSGWITGQTIMANAGAAFL
jgi:NAD(P)-dependent dehydrogenase (short-subunit alcohol dehydrogenase family)